jgi:Mg2+/Co2+ transporter CorB
LIDIPVGILLAILAVLILLSAFFAAAETAMMSLNRYRLRHLAGRKHRGAMRASALLKRPDRLIGLLLLGNTLSDVLASSVTTIIGLELHGELGIAIAAGILTFVTLIFGDVAPKTLGALHPEPIAFASAYILSPLLKICFPLVWVVNAFSNGLLRCMGVRADDAKSASLTSEELSIAVKEAGALIPWKHKQMLVGVLELEKVTVDDIMVPRSEIAGLDLSEDITTLTERVENCRHTRLPVYRDSLANVLGILHARQIPRLCRTHNEIDLDTLERIIAAPYYIPAGTPLHTQLANFQRQKQRLGLVVDEYGEIEGLVTLEDILEEIVGEFTTDAQVFSRSIFEEQEGSYLMDGSASIRQVNRRLHWSLPTEGPKTLNGLILETLESIPEPGTSLRVEGYTIEILQTTGNFVKTARLTPPPREDALDESPDGC